MKLFCNKCGKIFKIEDSTAESISCPDCGESQKRPESESSAGVVIGDFVLEKSLSKGGMGEVFIARQISLDRPVALKVLLKEYTNDRDYIATLFREARAAAKISHPNIVQAYAVGRDEETYYFAMELVRGDTLKNILREKGSLEVRRAAEIIRDIAKALDVAWREQKLVHQDIKPDNIMVDINGFSKLADLGLAKIGSTETAEENTASDEVLGTPQYISPEQLTGVSTDVRSDIYSLGATFYHIVTGKLPYRAADFEELARMHDAGKLTPPKEIKADLPDQVNDIIVKMMMRNIEMRYQSPAELIDDLTAFLEGKVSEEKKKIKISVPRLGIPGKKKNENSAEKENPSIDEKEEQKKSVKLSVPKANVAKTAEGGISKPTVSEKPMVPKPVNPMVPKPVNPMVPKPVNPAIPKPVVPKPLVPDPVVPQSVPANPAASPSGGVPDPVTVVDSGEKKKKIKKVIIISAVSILAVVVIAAAAVTVLGILESKKIMDPMILPVLEKITGKSLLPKEEAVAPEDAKKPAPVTLTRESTLEYFEVPDLSRPEYIKKAEALLQWRMNNQTEDAELLKKIDASWNDLRMPETARESSMLSEISVLFSAIDEQMRCIPAREELKKQHLDMIAQAQEAIDQRKEQERRAAEEQKKLQQEQARQAQEQARQAQQNAAETARRTSALAREADKYVGACIKTMHDAAITGADTEFKKALEEAKNFTSFASSFSPGEAKIINDTKMIVSVLPKEKDKMAKIFDRIKSVDARVGIRVLLKRGGATVIGIKPGELIYRGIDRKAVSLPISEMVPRTRKTLLIALSKHFNMPVEQIDFYYSLFNRQLPADNCVPNGFWKNIWTRIKSVF